jgi:hypothetical protein
MAAHTTHTQAARAAVQKAQEARKASDLAEKAARGAEEDALNAHTNTMRKVGGSSVQPSGMMMMMPHP